jgi:hypothetical protein
MKELFYDGHHGTILAEVVRWEWSTMFGRWGAYVKLAGQAAIGYAYPVKERSNRAEVPK